MENVKGTRTVKGTGIVQGTGSVNRKRTILEMGPIIGTGNV